MRVLVNGAAVKSDDSDSEIRFKGIRTVLEAKDSDARRVSLTVENCLEVIAGRSSSLLKNGDIVLAWLNTNDKVEMSMGGRPLDKELTDKLKEFTGIRTSKVDDDQIFGAPKAVKAGESWPINAKLAAEDFSREVAPVQEKNIQGAAKLERVFEDQGQKCLEVTGTLDMSGMDFPMPPPLKVETSRLSATFKGYFPIDVSRQPTYSESDMKMSIKASGVSERAGKKEETQMTVDNRQTKKIRASSLPGMSTE
jgi:hypothetical protein